jgi:hypothetical protein
MGRLSVPRGEVDVDTRLDQLIDKRAQENGAERDREALWAESVRRYRAQRSEDFTLAWHDHHRHLAQVHKAISAEHNQRADFLEGLWLEGGV